MAGSLKRFETVLFVPRVWQSLLEILSFDDLTAFLAGSPPPEVTEAGGFTRADWPRPVRNDHRRVSFSEDEYTVMLELMSGNGHYFAQPSIFLPNGDHYARSAGESPVRSKEKVEISGIGTFIWRQEFV